MDKATKIKGVSLIESLVCLVIIGIGFIGVNQMMSYATTSIDRSVEANKINFLSETAIEDIMGDTNNACLLYTSPSPRDGLLSRMPSSA